MTKTKHVMVTFVEIKATGNWRESRFGKENVERMKLNFEVELETVAG